MRRRNTPGGRQVKTTKDYYSKRGFRAGHPKKKKPPNSPQKKTGKNGPSITKRRQKKPGYTWGERMDSGRKKAREADLEKHHRKQKLEKNRYFAPPCEGIGS